MATFLHESNFLLTLSLYKKNAFYIQEKNDKRLLSNI